MGSLLEYHYHMFEILGETAACIVWMLIATSILMGLFIAIISIVKRNFSSSPICHIVYGILTLFLLVQSFQLVESIYAINCLGKIEISAQPLRKGVWDENFIVSLFDVGKRSLEHFSIINKYIDHYHLSLSDFSDPQIVIDTVKDKLYQFVGKQIAWIVGGMVISYAVIFFFVTDDSYSKARTVTPRKERERVNHRYRK